MSRGVLILCALVTLLSACAQRAGISGTGMMRVEVDVYKGPVADSVEAQRGELGAIFVEAAKSSESLKRQAVALATALDCSQARDDKHAADCVAATQVVADTSEIVAAICELPEGKRSPSGLNVSSGLFSANNQVEFREICGESSSKVEGFRDFIQSSDINYQPIITKRAMEIANMMRIKAVRSAEANIGYVPHDKRVRYLSTKTSYLLSEIAKSLSSRISILDRILAQCLQESNNDSRVATAKIEYDEYKRKNSNLQIELRQKYENISSINNEIQRDFELKQYIKERKALDEQLIQSEQTYFDKRNLVYFSCLDNSRDTTSKLPTSAYLRDVEPTGYLDAFDWFNANFSSNGTGAYARRNRERGIRSLNSGVYWEKVNEVYASGQGDVSMAFVKDELGNWNLKSYTNDPSKLLKAYRQGANALIEAAVDAAKTATLGGAGVAKGNGLLDLANRLATGRTSGAANIGGLSMATLHKRTKERLLAVQTRAKLRSEALGKADGSTGLIKAAADELSMTQTDAANAQTALTDAIARESAARRSLRNCGDDCDTVDADLARATQDLQAIRIRAANLAGEVRGKQDRLAILKAERDGLASTAAEDAMTILAEHQRDLATLQQVVVSENETNAGLSKPN